MSRLHTFVVTLAAGWVVSAASAEWDPANGQWGKEDPSDIRVMTWNVEDGICRTADKSESFNAWNALARIVAAMQPDVLILQEAGDNSGNGTGSGVDTVGQLEVTIDLFFHGGSDPFEGGTVGAFVQNYAPDYDLPYVFVSSIDDSYNRNVIISRFPFMDLNGDTVAQRPDIGFVIPDEYSEGGNGGIRGFMFAEFDLPDDEYAGDLVVGNAHLKAYSDEWEARRRAAQNVAYYIDFLLNGAGTGIPDPHDKITDQPPAQTILPDLTPVIIGGDWNEDELTNGRKGPAEWLTMAEHAGPDDGTDRDRSDMVYDTSVEPYSGNRATQASSKLDYLAWQDSIVELRRSFVFNSNALASVPSWMPPELIGYPIQPYFASGMASDHRPVIADFVLPVQEGLPGDLNCDGAVDFDDISPFVLALSGEAAYENVYPECHWLNGDANGDGTVDFDDITPFVGLLSGV